MTERVDPSIRFGIPMKRPYTQSAESSTTTIPHPTTGGKSPFGLLVPHEFEKEELVDDSQSEKTKSSDESDGSQPESDSAAEKELVQKEEKEARKKRPKNKRGRSYQKKRSHHTQHHHRHKEEKRDRKERKKRIKKMKKRPKSTETSTSCDSSSSEDDDKVERKKRIKKAKKSSKSLEYCTGDSSSREDDDRLDRDGDVEGKGEGRKCDGEDDDQNKDKLKEKKMECARGDVHDASVTTFLPIFSYVKTNGIKPRPCGSCEGCKPCERCAACLKNAKNQADYEKEVAEWMEKHKDDPPVPENKEKGPGRKKRAIVDHGIVKKKKEKCKNQRCTKIIGTMFDPLVIQKQNLTEEERRKLEQEFAQATSEYKAAVEDLTQKTRGSRTNAEIIAIEERIAKAGKQRTELSRRLSRKSHIGLKRGSSYAWRILAKNEKLRLSLAREIANRKNREDNGVPEIRYRARDDLTLLMIKWAQKFKDVLSNPSEPEKWDKAIAESYQFITGYGFSDQKAPQPTSVTPQIDL